MTPTRATDIEIHQGYDYYDTDSQAFEWTSDGTWPDLTDATATFIIDGRLEDAGAIADPAGTPIITVELTRVQTASLSPRSSAFDYVLNAELANGHLILLAYGKATIVRQKTAS